MLEVKGGTLKITKLFEQGFNKEDVLNVLGVLNARIYELENQLECEKSKNEKLQKELEKLKSGLI